jgi:hypothetical protein
MPFPRLAPAALLFVVCTGILHADTTAPAPVIKTQADALPRWREHLPALIEAVRLAPINLLAHESPHTPLPEMDPALLEAATASLSALELAPGETVAPVRIHGPETPFPDNGHLRQLAGLRAMLARHALAVDEPATALAHARQNLVHARVALREQEGIIPLIHATGVWQAALDSVHSLARHPGLTETDARALLAELQADSDLAQTALTRAFRGEFTHVFKVVAERMPAATDDPDFFLSAVSSLGMAPPEPLPAGELGLGLTEHAIFDLPATLAAAEADLAPYLAAFAAGPRYPRGLYATTTARTLAGHREKLGRFYLYAIGELEPTLPNLVLARADLIAAQNPGGKLLIAFMTPAWDPLIVTTLRREAQRSALCVLLAWRIHGEPAQLESLVAAGLLPAPPADPFSDAPLRVALGPHARVWSAFANGADDGGHLTDANFGLPDDLVWLP